MLKFTASLSLLLSLTACSVAQQDEYQKSAGPKELHHYSRAYAERQGDAFCSAYISTYCSGCETDGDCWDCILDNGSELMEYCTAQNSGRSAHDFLY